MTIDRKKLVERHHPRMTGIDPLSPLSVGNGTFAFTADVTGLQTFPEAYKVPLGTQSQWGWHYTGRPGLHDWDDLVLQSFDFHGKKVGYPLYVEGRDEAYHWLRQNPHRLQLGQLSFRLLKENGEPADANDLQQPEQVLNLWEGVLYSTFAVENQPVSVITACHPETDQLGVSVTSPLIREGRLQVVLRFPAPDMTSRVWEESVFPDWEP